MRLNRNRDILNFCKSIIKRHISPKLGTQEISIRDAKKAISLYRKVSKDKIGLIDLMISFVEYGTQFIIEVGDLYEQYYCSLELVFRNALNLMKDLKPEDIVNFEQRAHGIVEKSDGIGWGYGDAIYDIFNTYAKTPKDL